MIQFIKLTQNWSMFVVNTTIPHYYGLIPPEAASYKHSIETGISST